MEALLLKFVEGISSQLGASSVSFLQFMCCFCFGDEKTKLESRLSTVKARLLDAEEQQDHTHTKKNLIEKLPPILYEAEDLLEEIKLYETADVERRNILCRFFKTTIPFHIRMPLKLKAINERLAKFIPERVELPQSRRYGGCPNRRNEETRMEPQSYKRSSDIIGREKDKEAVKNMLKESSMSSDGSNVPIIIPIIGMGGLGKTTLARYVYEDVKDVKDDAEGFLKMWVWVSQDFDVKRLLIEVIEAATGKICKLKGMDQLQSKLRECLDGKKYLLVLDDIWNTNSVSWNDLGNLLKGGEKGSAILATTREMKVASTMDADPKYQYLLKGLDKDDCWSLFEQPLRFKIDQMEEKQMFVAIGNEILKKCGGNPLAIMTVVGLLLYEDPEEWVNVKNDRLWSQAQDKNHILPSLEVSYARLPSNLKKCFAYCSLFTKGDKIEKTKLTQLWIAQGFIKADSADKCFNELRNRFFLQEENYEYVDVTSCKMHDLMYDLAREVAGPECIIVNDDEVNHDGVLNISERTIHASVKVFYNDKTTCVDRLIKNGILPTKASNLRTLLTSGIYDDSKPDFYTTFKRLRVLELTLIWEDNPNVLNSLRKLVHLRYLDLSESDFRMLPNSICKLRCLQTLKLNYCRQLEELPGDIKKLTSLIHLENKGCDRLKGLPLGIGQLTSIQTLSEFVLGGKGWAGLSELEGLNNLRGDLLIQILHNARNAISESMKAFYLKDIKHLQKLELRWETSEDEDRDKDVALLESLQPNPHLKELYIHGYGGVKFPSWMDNIGKSLPNLVEITLEDCPSCECLPLFVDQLRSLKVLFLDNLPKLEYIRSYVSDSPFPPTSSSPFNSNILSGAAGFFPALKNVFLQDLPELKEWSIEVIVGDDGGKPKTDSAAATQPKQLLSLNTLSTFWVNNCPELTSVPSFPNIETLGLDDVSGALIQSMTMAETICPTTSSLPSFLTLSKLKSLHILRCKDLVSLPQGWLENFTSLDHLWIFDCAQLESLSRETPQMPKDLKGKALDFPEEDDLQSCRKLRSLELKFLPKLSSLPKGLQHATELRIYECPGLDLPKGL